jgi:acyl-CoA thioesterase FadM
VVHGVDHEQARQALHGPRAAGRGGGVVKRVIVPPMATEESLPDPARIVIQRRIEWMDTDAAGIYHWTTAFRLAEAAEAALHTALGIPDTTFGASPRVAVSASFTRPLRFNDPVDVELAVVGIGRASLDYRFTITGEAGQAAEGSLTACFIDRSTGRAAPWPAEIRERLASGGRQDAGR